MRLICRPLAVALAMIVIAAMPATASATRARAIDECKLMADRQARTIMGVKPFGGPSPDNGGCSWQTDLSDRANLAFVTVKVEPATKLLASYDDDLRTYLVRSTNVGIDDLPGVGDEAFSTYSPLSGPATSDGISVLVRDRVVSLGFQAVEKIENPSRRFDGVVRIMKKVVAKVRAARPASTTPPKRDAAANATEAVEGLVDAWNQDDRVAAGFFGDPSVVDYLFAKPAAAATKVDCTSVASNPVEICNVFLEDGRTGVMSAGVFPDMETRTGWPVFEVCIGASPEDCVF